MTTPTKLDILAHHSRQLNAAAGRLAAAEERLHNLIIAIPGSSGRQRDKHNALLSAAFTARWDAKREANKHCQELENSK
jgi:hypothetical protein